MKLLKLFFIGTLMGLADLVPGVSSGTVAYSLNIYKLWIDALGSISLTKLTSFQFKCFFKEIHFQVLLPILLGILVSLAIFTPAIFYILNNDYLKNIFLISLTLLLTFSCICFSKEINLNSKQSMMYIFLGFVIAILVSIIPKASNIDPSYIYIFISAAIASFAMILPGISGSSVLLILNLYEPLIQRIKESLNDIIQLKLFSPSILFLSVFSLGVLVGVAVFSKFLKKLLNLYKQKTNQILLGIMLGCICQFTNNFSILCITLTLLVLLYKYSIDRKILIT